MEKAKAKGIKNVKIKICGLTDEKEAEYLIRNRVDFAGMVLFYEKSRRCIARDKAEKIIKALSGQVKSVAVVVSPTFNQVKEIEEAGFDYIQIHGTLKNEIMNECRLPILKAFNVSDLESYPYYNDCKEVAGFVFDAVVPGSGKTYDWQLLSSLPKSSKICFLAGGLNPGNVADAIRLVHPDAVDVSTGVEYDGMSGKDPEKIALFCKNARETRC